MSHQAKVRQWASRVIVEPKEGEESRVKRIRVQSETHTWDTWEAPFPSGEEWSEQVEALIDAQADELPIRRHTLTFSALDDSDGVISQIVTSFQGKNKDAGKDGGATNAAAKAISDAVEGLARTMNTVLRSAEMQCGSLTKSLESQGQQIHDLIELVKAKQENEIVANENASQQNAEITQMILGQLQQFGGPVLELAKMWLERQPPSVVGAMHKAAEVATNGKAAH